MVEQRLKSKKNNVYKKERIIDGRKCYVVEKEISEKNRFLTELNLSQMLGQSGINTPRLLEVLRYESHEDNGIGGKLIYEYIQGDVALDVIAEKSCAECEKLIKQIINWIKQFYEITLEKWGEQWIFGDIHLRNFIYDPTRCEIFGFDFEEAKIGIVEQDVARLFLFIMTYEPEYSTKNMRLAEYFLREALIAFPLDRSKMIQEIEAEACRMAKRRNSEIRMECILPILDRNLK